MNVNFCGELQKECTHKLWRSGDIESVHYKFRFHGKRWKQGYCNWREGRAELLCILSRKWKQLSCTRARLLDMNMKFNLSPSSSGGSITSFDQRTFSELIFQSFTSIVLNMDFAISDRNYTENFVHFCHSNR